MKLALTSKTIWLLSFRACLIGFWLTVVADMLIVVFCMLAGIYINRKVDIQRKQTAQGATQATQATQTTQAPQTTQTPLAQTTQSSQGPSTQTRRPQDSNQQPRRKGFYLSSALQGLHRDWQVK